MARSNKKWKRKHPTVKETLRNERKKETVFGLLIVLVLIVAAVAGGWFLLQQSSTTQERIGPKTAPNQLSNTSGKVGETAPDFTLTDIDGNSFNLSNYRGNVVVIDFMATWCGPCIQQMANLKEVHTRYTDRGVTIISIDVTPGETENMLRQFKADYGDEWIFALGPDIGLQYQLLYIPAILIVDQNGVIQFWEYGNTSASKISNVIDSLLG